MVKKDLSDSKIVAFFMGSIIGIAVFAPICCNLGGMKGMEMDTTIDPIDIVK